jgi:DNA-binding CsgD family transcriptional regulator
MDLLEREAELRQLEDALEQCAVGFGSVVLVAGEGGIGKTRLVRTFTDDHAEAAEILWGACDDLSTPRPLGPFRDIAADVGGALQATFASQPSRTEVFDAVLAALGSGGRPTVMVVEDVHWADGATLDVLKFLGRRIERMPVVVVITFRDDEIGPDHPLTMVFGDLPSGATRRLELAPLSRTAVATLASDYPGSKDELFAATGGNPFLVTEALTVPEFRVPPSVRDAVLTRLGRLSSAGRDLAEAASIIPRRAERGLLAQVARFGAEALDEVRQRGLMEHDESAVWFRHELVRGAVRDALPPERRRRLNADVLAVLVETDDDVARIVHHAREAGDRSAVVRYSPMAARQAADASAHREALTHYRHSVDYLDDFDDADRAPLLFAYATECYLTNEAIEGLAAAQRALELWRAGGDAENEGVTLRLLSRLHWWLGHAKEAETTGVESVEVLESIGDSPHLPMSYSNLAQLSMLAQDSATANHWSTKAIESARVVGDQEALAHALNNLGSTQARAGNVAGLDLLRESLEVSLRGNLEDHAGRAYANLIWTLLDYRELDEAADVLDEGLEYALKRDLEGSGYYMVAERARLHLDRGEWAAAERDAAWVMKRPEQPGITRMPASATLALLKVRRGDADADAVIAEAKALADPTGELQRLAPVAVARAERAWLAQNRSDLRDVIEPVYERALTAPQPWIFDELAFWMWRAGTNPALPEGSESPFVAQMQGRWAVAAAGWNELRCPYEEALALFDADEPDPLLTSLAILDDLGAIPAARLVRRKLHDLDVPGVPRGPRPLTRANPAGLTSRQLEVLQLLAQGLTNAEIGERLFVSPKTVDHHVSAILAKLDAATRHDAARVAAERGLLT